MAIEFHCDHCGALVRAADEAGGQRGQCASCHQSVYIPTPDPQIEPLDLAPVDAREERERRRLLRESQELAQRVLHERATLPEPGGGRRRAGAAGAARGGGAEAGRNTSASLGLSPADVEKLVIDYALAMFSGDLSGAEDLAADIRRNLRTAEDVMQRMTLDELPPARLAHIPRPVLVGFFKRLRGAS